MEQNWDPQMMLELYIHNYLIKKNRHTTAELFAREADFYPKPVAIDTPEGFLSEWWSIFWRAYSAKFPDEEDSSSKNTGNLPQYVHPAVMQNPNVNNMLQNMYSTMQRQGPPSMLQNMGSTITPRPNIGNLMQSNLSTMMPFPGLKLPFSGFNMTPGQNINAPIAKGMHEQERLRFAARDVNPNSQFLNIEQLARMLPSSSNSSLPQERVYKNPQLCLTRDYKCGTSLWRSTAADPAPSLPKPIELKLKHAADTGSKMHEQECLNHPVRNLNTNSQILGVDQLARFLPFSSIYGHSQEEVEKKPLFSVTRDERCGTSAAPAYHPPTTIQLKMEPTDTDARVHEKEHFGISFKNMNFNSQPFDVNQLATLLTSSNNFSNPQKNKKRQLSVNGGDEKCGTSLKKSTAAEPTHHSAKAHQPKAEPADTGIHEQGHFGFSVGELNSISQLLDADELSCLLPCSSNCRHPQKNDHKKSHLSFTRDDKGGTSVKKLTATKPTHKAPKAIQAKKKNADSGSSASSNCASSGPSS